MFVKVPFFSFLMVLFLLFSPVSKNLYSQDFQYNLNDLEKIFVVFSPSEKVYYLNAPIFFNYQIENQILNTNFRFKKFVNPFIQFEFMISKEDNQNPEQTISLDAFAYHLGNGDFSKIRGKDSKIIEIAFDEGFRGKVDLSSFVDFSEIGEYTITGFFYPLGKLENLNQALERNDEDTARLYRIPIQPFSFRITRNQVLNLNEYPLEDPLEDDGAGNPSVSSMANVANLVSGDANIFSSPQSLMKEHLAAFQAKDWELYLSTFNLEELLKNSYNSTVFYERFTGAFFQERPFVIADFKKFLIDSLDYEIKEAVILKTLIERNREATIDVFLTLRESYERLEEVYNQITLQQEETWIKEPNEFLDKNFIYQYKLVNFSGEWKIVSVEARQVEELPQDNDQEDFDIKREDNLGNLEDFEIIGNIFFDTGSVEIRLEDLDFLQNVYAYLQQNPDVKLRIVGHTDNIGSSEANVILSERRSERVANYFISRGINENRIDLSYRGETMPIDSNNTVRGKQQNRRVELFLFQ